MNEQAAPGISFALIHSPLVGPGTWQPVSDALEQAGHQVVIPELVDLPTVAIPFWQQHAESAAGAIQAADLEADLVLVGHSGAGPLLPAIGERLHQSPGAYLFVDAGIPQDGASRLDLMKLEMAEWADEFESHLLEGGCFPEWGKADLENLILDRELRRETIQGLRPRARDFFVEPIEALAEWADTPCGYLQFTGSYDVPARQAVRDGWLFMRLDVGHFHMLVDPGIVASIVMQMAGKLVS